MRTLFDDVAADFDGDGYESVKDRVRLTGQIERIARAMSDGAWRTLAEIEALTGDGQASVSAQLRNLRKERFGSRKIRKRSRGDRSSGLWEYRLEPEVVT